MKAFSKLKKSCKFRIIKKACKIYTLQAFKIYSDPGGVRTPNPQSRNLIFYPVELRGQKIFKFSIFKIPNSKFSIGIWNLYIELSYLEFGVSLLEFKNYDSNFFTIVEIVFPSAVPPN